MNAPATPVTTRDPHWALRPEHDTRTWLPPERRGLRRPGHALRLPCAACVELAAQPSTPAPQESRATVPPKALAPSTLPAAERPTVPTGGDPALPPTLRPVAPEPRQIPAPARLPCRLCGEPAAKSTSETDPELVALCPKHRSAALKRRWETRSTRKSPAVVPPLTDLDRVLLGALVVTLDGWARVQPSEVASAIATMGGRNTDGSDLQPLRAAAVLAALSAHVEGHRMRREGAFFQLTPHGMRAAGALLRNVGALRGER